VLAVAGAISHAEVLALINKEQHRFRQGPNTLFAPFDFVQKEKRAALHYKPIEQCHLQFGFPTVGRYSEREWALRVLNTLAGENMSSALFQEIREERGLAYHITSSQDFHSDVGSFSVQCGVDAENVEECVSESLRLLYAFKTKKVDKGDLERAKHYLIGQALQDMESTLSHMLFAGDKLLGLDREFSTSAYCEKINKVTAEEILEAANLFFNESCLNLALIGPYNNEKQLLNRMTL
jgi:predicted Zn-dependent peptidase